MHKNIGMLRKLKSLYIRFRVFSSVHVLLLLLLTSFPCFAQSDKTLEPVLTQFAQISAIGPNELHKRHRVDLQCIVMCYEPDWAILFVHDGKQGGYIGNPKGLTLQPGNRIRIRGILGPQRTPIEMTIEPSENGIQFPAPKPVDFDWLHSGKEDSQFVEIEGQLIGTDVDHGQTCLVMSSLNGGRFRGLIRHHSEDKEKLSPFLGKRLKLRGVVGAIFDGSGQWSGFQIWMSTLHNLELAADQDKSSIPIVPIAELTADYIRRTKSFYFRTQGILTHRLSHSILLLQDETDQLFVESAKPFTLPVDQSYEVSGSLDTSVVPPILRMAELKPTEKQFEVKREAAFHSIDKLIAGDFSGQIVKTKGTYYGSFRLKDQNGFLIEYDGNLLPVMLNDESLDQKPAAGTEIEVEGVWVQQKSLIGFNIGSSALFARKQTVVIGTQVPWIVLSTLGIAFLISASIGVWAITLRQQVRRKTQQVLDSVALQRQTEERYASIFINAQVMVMTADDDGRITTINPAVVRVTKISEPQLLGAKLSSLVTQDSREALEELLKTAKTSNQICNCQANLLLTDGKTIPQEVSCWVVQHNQLITYQLIWHDITERLKMELQRTEMEQHMRAMQKMESLGVLAGGIAHDFNNLLAVILGNASLLSATALSNDQAERVAGIEEGAARASELTQQMLAYAGRGRFDIRVLNVSLIVDEMSHLLQASASKNVKLQFELDREIQGVNADATQLKQILLNLVRNGSEAMEGREGSIYIRCYRVIDLPEPEPGMLTMNFLKSDGYPLDGFVCLEVADQGCGIEETSLRSIFDPFYSTKFSGRGLGLSNVMGIVRSHQGCICVKSARDRGTIFRIYLPTCTDPITQQLRPTASPSVSLTNVRVLVVDDEPAVLDVLTRNLELLRIKVIACQDGIEALNVLNDQQIELDCLITDQTMPRVSGIELCHQARTLRPNLPTILCSGYTIESADSDLGKKCVSASIQKPFLPSELVELMILKINESKARQLID